MRGKIRVTPGGVVGIVMLISVSAALAGSWITGRHEGQLNQAKVDAKCSVLSIKQATELLDTELGLTVLSGPGACAFMAGTETVLSISWYDNPTNSLPGQIDTSASGVTPINLPGTQRAVTFTTDGATGPNNVIAYKGSTVINLNLAPGAFTPSVFRQITSDVLANF
jgi:hypothetical protein